MDDYKPLVQGEALAFEPGARYKYSNAGMLLLGVVIEKASGRNYFDRADGKDRVGSVGEHANQGKQQG